jgi:hypothetical protein
MEQHTMYEGRIRSLTFISSGAGQLGFSYVKGIRPIYVLLMR